MIFKWTHFSPPHISEPLKVDNDLLSIGDIVDTLSITSAAGLRRPRFRTATKKIKKVKG